MFQVTSIIRSLGCSGGCVSGLCQPCKRVHLMLRKRLLRQKKQLSVPCSRAPLRHYSRAKLATALQLQRRRARELQKKIQKISRLMEADSVPISKTLHGSLQTILDGEHLVNPVTRLFWEEQKKNFVRNPCARR